MIAQEMMWPRQLVTSCRGLFSGVLSPNSRMASKKLKIAVVQLANLLPIQGYLVAK
jgi:hypothetical protein